MAKRPPPNQPKVSDRVRMRGREFIGVVTYINPDTLWTQVRWDGDFGPRYCHKFELEVVSPKPESL